MNIDQEKNIQTITESVKSGKDTFETIRIELQNSEDQQKKTEHELEQYSRRIHINISVITDTNPSETQSRVFKKSHFHTLRDRSRRPDYRIHRYCTHNAEKERKKQRHHSKTCVTNEKKKKYYITTKI